ncbi:hypothetical protein [Frondihabitans peucedani]|uniref:Protein kinase domain-containing protein n=1 Tax=Frondihabitans peucedani TaxID=598626 RepID=A0ABP8DY43_9MICO
MPIPPTPPGAPGDLLASGPRADVFEWRPAADDPTEPLVVKLYRGSGATAEALALGVALATAQHEHVVRLAGLVDLGSRGVGVLLPRLGTTTAQALLARRRVITAGEAVTLVAPILLALLHLERRGLDPRVRLTAATGLDDILFDDRGAPLLTSLRVVGLDDPRLLEPAATARALVDEVLAATHGGRAGSRRILETLCEAEASIDELLEVVFELDEPAPLEGAQDPPAHPEPEPAGSGGSPAPAALTTPVRRLTAGALAASTLAASTLAALRQTRPRVWAGAAALVVSSVVGLIVVGAPSSSPPDAATASVSASASVSTSAGGGARAATSPAASPATSPAAFPTADREAETAAVLAGDDADGAARVLLRLRAACLEALDSECLAGVDEPESPALLADTAAVDDPALLADLPVPVEVRSVVNRLGGAVLYAAAGHADDEPASVLVTRTEAGWRVRTVSRSGPPG